MRGKKLDIIGAVILVTAIAVPVILHVTKSSNAPSETQTQDTQTQVVHTAAEPVSLPHKIETDSALQSAASDDSPIQTADAMRNDPASEQAILFGQSYPARVWRSSETFVGADGIEAPAQRRTEYLDKDENILFFSVHEKDDMAVYNAQGQILYSSGAYQIEANFLTEPVHWFYKDGAPVCAEVCYYNEDGSDSGVAYYGADGSLLCMRAEVFRTDDNGVQMQTEFRDAQENTITEDDFLLLLPQTDADDFLYINWA